MVVNKTNKLRKCEKRNNNKRRRKYKSSLLL